MSFELKESKFFEELFQEYLKIKIPEEYSDICNIDSNLFWYYSDSQNKIVCDSSNKNKIIVEIDINSAFLTICRNIFPNSEFLDHLERLKDNKLERNKFIAINLKHTGHLERLNWMCKMIITGVIFSITDKINIFELKKDGVICTIDEETNLYFNDILNIKNDFINFIKNAGFTFSIQRIFKYVRDNKTSFILYDNYELKIKGRYKNLSNFLYQKIFEIISNVISLDSLEELKIIYSSDFLYVLRKLDNKKLIEKYYLCDNGKYLSESGKYVDDLNQIYPEKYFEIFVIPTRLCGINL